MKLFRRKTASSKACRSEPELALSERCREGSFSLPLTVEPFEKELYDRLRLAVPVIDAAIMKIISAMCRIGKTSLRFMPVISIPLD